MTDEATNEGQASAADDRSAGLHRRGLVRGLALGSVAIGAGVVGGVASRAAAATPFRRERLVVDVACLGETFRESTRSNPANDADFRGAFVVEGWIYPEGTIKGDGFIPREEGSIGRWICRGASLGDATRSEPHTSSNTLFAFGTIRPENVFPRNSLHTVGLEGTSDRAQTCWRAA